MKLLGGCARDGNEKLAHLDAGLDWGAVVPVRQTLEYLHMVLLTFGEACPRASLNHLETPELGTVLAERFSKHWLRVAALLQSAQVCAKAASEIRRLTHVALL
jgi:hypothetical protein